MGFCNKWKTKNLVIVSIAIIFLNCCIIFSLSDKQPASETVIKIVINEAMSSNYRFNYDKNDETSDWIELKNTGKDSINLKNWCLSDDKENPLKFRFPDRILEPGEILLVRASDKNSTETAELHAPFKLSSKGETLYLRNPSGQLVDTVIIPQLSANESYGRPYSNSEQWTVLSEASPGKENTNSLLYNEKLPSLSANISTPLCEVGAMLILTNTDSDAVVHYTTDGSIPDLSSPVLSGPLELTKQLYNKKSLTSYNTVTENYNPPKIMEKRAVVVRARAFRDGYIPSDVFTGNYFFEDVLSTRKMPIMHITVSPEDFMDPNDGIYILGNVYKNWRIKNPDIIFQGDTPANYNQRGGSWRIPAAVQFIDGTKGFTSDIELKILGGWSRANAQKSFQIFFCKKTDESCGLNYELFPGLMSRDGECRSIDFFKSVLLRNGGNDWQYTLYRDALIQGLVSKFSLDTQASRPLAIYINGEYWGILNMREAYDECYFSQHYGIPLDKSIVYENAGSRPEDIKIGEEDDYQWYTDLLKDVRNTDFTQNGALEQFKGKIDFENHALYNAIQCWIANKDWPGNNIRYWRSIPNQSNEESKKNIDANDGALRWLLYDTEFSMNIYDPNHYKENMFNLITAKNGRDWPNPPWSTELMRYLIKNDEYQTLFINACCDLMNTVFNEQSFEKGINEMIELYTPEMQAHWDRWSGVSGGVAGGSMRKWIEKSKAILKFAGARESFFLSQMKLFFSLSEPVSVAVSVGSGGRVILNNITLEEDFSGFYYPGHTISLKAIPEENYTFVGWKNIAEPSSILYSDKEITVDPADTINVQAAFTK